MAKKYIIDYLKENKDKFPLYMLKKKLLGAGYPEGEIDEAIKILQQPIPEVLKPERVPAKFWDFRHKKIYLSRKEKFLDFIFGFLIGIAIPWLLNLLMRLIFYPLGFFRILFNLIFYLALIIYFLIIKRGYISFGMILSLPLSFVFSIILLLFKFLL